jgi:hypothetical protein
MASVSYLIVAGGGAGGTAANTGYFGTNAAGAGGSGGQVQTGSSVVGNNVGYPIVVGNGGTVGIMANNPSPGTAGGNSSAFGVTSVGGGYGGGGGGTGGQYTPTTGAYGGGGAGQQNSGYTGPAQVGAIGSVAYSGGTGYDQGGLSGSGGGGGGAAGAGGNGSTGNPSYGGNGGTGYTSSISGSSVTYSSGGQGGGSSSQGGAGSTYGGGGGGGNANSNTVGTAGNPGIVILSAPIGTFPSVTGGTHTTSGGNDIWTFTSSGTWTPTVPSVAYNTSLSASMMNAVARYASVNRLGHFSAKLSVSMMNAAGRFASIFTQINPFTNWNLVVVTVTTWVNTYTSL